jgi:hypothetical protein
METPFFLFKAQFAERPSESVVVAELVNHVHRRYDQFCDDHAPMDMVKMGTLKILGSKSDAKLNNITAMTFIGKTEALRVLETYGKQLSPQTARVFRSTTFIWNPGNLYFDSNDFSALTKITFNSFNIVFRQQDGGFSSSFSLPSLTTVVFTEGPVIIPKWQFADCHNLERVIFAFGRIPQREGDLDHRVSVGERAFFGCRSLVAFGHPDAAGYDMPPGCWTKIDLAAFDNTGFTAVHISWRTALHSIMQFRNCSKLKFLTFGEQEPPEMWKGYEYRQNYQDNNMNAKRAKQTAFGDMATVFDYEKIPTSCFARSMIESVFLPKYIVGADEGAFEDCPRLHTICCYNLWGTRPVRREEGEDDLAYDIRQARQRSMWFFDAKFASNCPELRLVVDMALDAKEFPTRFLREQPGEVPSHDWHGRPVTRKRPVWFPNCPKMRPESIVYLRDLLNTSALAVLRAGPRLAIGNGAEGVRPSRFIDWAKVLAMSLGRRGMPSVVTQEIFAQIPALTGPREGPLAIEWHTQPGADEDDDLLKFLAGKRR